MFPSVVELRTSLHEVVAGLEPATLRADDALALLADFDHIEKMAAAAKLLVSRRIAETDAWKSKGDRSAAHFLARSTGTSIGQAVTTLETARRLDRLPATEAALRSGELSSTQANEIASVAAASPEVEHDLLAVAAQEGLAGLRRRCRELRQKATNETDDRARHEAIRRSRYLRSWTDADGAFRLDVRTTPDDGARLLAGLATHRETVFACARAEGRREAFDAYSVDALVGMAEASLERTGGKTARGTRAKIIVRIDHAALLRGYAVEGEVCEIAGIGPVPVAAIQDLMGDALFAVVVTKGKDVVNVAHLGRQVTAHQRTALEWSNPTCSVLGCPATDLLEIDHRTGWAVTRKTELTDLDRLCHYHHGKKTSEGWQLEPGKGKRRFLPPGHPDLAVRDRRAATMASRK
jgi:hypothetical protein